MRYVVYCNQTKIYAIKHIFLYLCGLKLEKMIFQYLNFHFPSN